VKDRACESETAPDSEIDQTRLHVPPVFHSKPADQCSVAGAGPEKNCEQSRIVERSATGVGRGKPRAKTERSEGKPERAPG